jgi:enoyl-[acyl-carrier protein] reductase III
MTSVRAGRPVALVTGASRGVGRAIALQLASQGHDIVVNYLRNAEAAHETLDCLEQQGARGWLMQANIGEPAEIKTMFDDIRQFGRLDVVVHNAALGTFKNLLDIRPNQLELAFRVNAFGLLWLAREALPLLPQPGGRIIALSSIGSTRVVPHYGIVGPSKAALESLARYLAHELYPRGISVNVVSGGFVDTDALRAFPEWETLAAAAVDRTPGRRIGSSADLAQVVGLLASGSADWMCGQVLLADGGFSLT